MHASHQHGYKKSHGIPSLAASPDMVILGQGGCKAHITPALLTVGVDGLPEGLSLGKDKGHNDAVDSGQWPQCRVFITEDSALGTAGTIPLGAGGEHGLVPQRAMSVR